MKKKTVGFIIAAALLTPSLLFGMSSFDYPEVDPVVSLVEGSVQVKAAGAVDWEKAKVGKLLSSGDTVKTGASSKAEISCATGKVRLYENTVVIIPRVVDEGEKRDIRRMDLDEGTGLFNIKKRGVEKGFEVQTSNIIAGVKGTLYAVLHGKKEKYSKVAVYRGVVEVSDKERTPGTKTRLRRGDFLEVTGQSGFGEPDEFGPDNAWYRWERVDSLELSPPKAESEGADSGYSGPQE